MEQNFIFPHSYKMKLTGGGFPLIICLYFNRLFLFITSPRTFLVTEFQYLIQKGTTGSFFVFNSATFLRFEINFIWIIKEKFSCFFNKSFNKWIYEPESDDNLILLSILKIYESSFWYYLFLWFLTLIIFYSI